MSPIVYVPSNKHECKPPGQGERYSIGYEGLYPEGTIWECDVCCSDWELEYEYYGSSIYGDFEGKYRTTQVFWNRLDY